MPRKQTYMDWAWGECGGCEYVGDLIVKHDEPGLLECILCGAATVIDDMPLYPAKGKTEKERKDKYEKMTEAEST